MQFKCGNCKKMFLATQAQIIRSRRPSTPALRSDGFMCSAVCAGQHASLVRRQKTGRQMGPQAAAHYAVNRAVKNGDLIKPKICTVCGKNPGKNKRGRSNLQAHHEDYARPLDVEWLCVVCHGGISPRKIGAENNKTKLTEVVVRKIKYGILKDLPVAFLMQRLGVSKATINQIKTGTTWRHV